MFSYRKLKKVIWLIGAAVLLAAIFLPGYTRLQDLKAKNKDLTLKIEKLNRENVLLENEIRHLEKSPLYQEKIVRDKMGVVRRGEIPITIIPDTE